MRNRTWLKNFVTRPTALVLALAVVSSAHVRAQMDSAPVEAPVSVPLLVPGEMNGSDAKLAADGQAAIARSAQLYGYILDSSYSYREIACPFAPRHLLLTYESSQAGATSRFTAVLPRDGNGGDGPGAVQIIPVLHFGVVPFVPAFSSPHAIDVFNRVVTPGPAGGAAVAALNSGEEPLLIRGLCYAAMAGEPPVALRRPSLEQATVHAPVPTLLFLDKGLMRQGFTIRNSPSSFQVWTLTFSPTGQLVAAQREEHKIDTTPVTLRADAPAQLPVVSTLPQTGSGPGVAVSPAAGTSGQAATQAVGSVRAEPNATAVSSPATAVAEVPSALPATVATPALPSVPVVEPSSTSAASLVVSSTTSAASPSPQAKFIAQPSAALPPLPQPQRRLISNLPMPPSRIIPDSSLKTPPQAPAK